MKKFILIALFLSSGAWANLHLAPPDFRTSVGKAIFVDFKKAEYDITYDLETEVTTVKTRITFYADKEGHPIFDLIPEPKKIKVDGNSTKQFPITFPGGVSELRQLSWSVTRGTHVLEMENTFTTNVIYDTEWSDVSSAFWIRDLNDRLFLEQYIPSNFEFDQYQITFHVNIKGPRKIEQDFYTNGSVSRTSPTSWKIEFPKYFTVSCPYFHMTPRKSLSRMDFTYKSVSGRDIPVTVYSPWKSRTKRFKAETIRVMQELEADYGPWAHPTFVAYGKMKGTGGMEHSGATATSFSALDHEMLHSYFAKGVMPANGNSGWIDEAIASWRDKGYPRKPTPGFGGSDLGADSVYKRNTDRRAYSLGAAFLSYLDWRLQDRGGLKAFLRGYFQTYKHTVITTEHFKNNLEFFSGVDLDDEFGTYIWGETTPDTELLLEDNPNHVPMTIEDLRSII